MKDAAAFQISIKEATMSGPNIIAGMERNDIARVLIVDRDHIQLVFDGLGSSGAPDGPPKPVITTGFLTVDVNYWTGGDVEGDHDFG